mmetsp:Transcript_8791/g.14921  ORF Transcript_8791/g.14921 Transcript_8791/m.14921 type:complete len:105 (-) Transcript_8791:435-749(-)
MKERLRTRIQSQLQTLRLQHDKHKTQCKIDNDRLLLAMRQQIKAQAESEHIKRENEVHSSAFNFIKDLQEVELEKYKIEAKREADQKVKVIEQEYQLLSDQQRK